MKHTIWSNVDLNLDDWRDDILNIYPDKSEEQLFDIMIDWNNDDLDSQRENLSSPVGATIVAIADLGLWNRRASAFKLFKSGKISDCLYSEEDYVEWFVEDGEFKSVMHHHDGSNYILYRKFKPNVSEEGIEDFCDQIYSGVMNEETIEEMTEPLGADIAKVFGWED